ncbi:U-box domain-containing protein 4-like [Canna indica]|uniref:U-box domain-containing protein 4-like n=1 Tax=Canna indica TaxID=4628 RepID=A0AAQ3KQF0_9LILI|nr:U-box domain-containing protein 4-like [Canna indica]
MESSVEANEATRYKCCRHLASTYLFKSPRPPPVPSRFLAGLRGVDWMESSNIGIYGEDSIDVRGGDVGSVLVQGIMERIQSEDEEDRVQAAREIRRLTKTSATHRRYLYPSIEPLVSMLRSGSSGSGEAAMLGLLNLAVKDERNKIKIVDAGALGPLIFFLESTNSCLQEYATASLLTLSAASINKPKISASGAIPLLVKMLRNGSQQATVDAVMALYNLSTIPNNLDIIISLQPIPALINLLKSCKKYSKTVEKCCALLDLLMVFEEGRIALTLEEGGVLTVIEVLEEGSPRSREHAVGILLTMCESDCCRYREVILKEGVIPGLLELTIQGTAKSQAKAQLLLELLRSPSHRSDVQADALQNIVGNFVSEIDDDDRAVKAKQMLAEMVQISMEQSLRHLQRRAVLCTPQELPCGYSPSRLHSK